MEGVSLVDSTMSQKKKQKKNDVWTIAHLTKIPTDLHLQKRHGWDGAFAFGCATRDKGHWIWPRVRRDRILAMHRNMTKSSALTCQLAVEPHPGRRYPHLNQKNAPVHLDRRSTKSLNCLLLRQPLTCPDVINSMIELSIKVEKSLRPVLF